MQVVPSSESPPHTVIETQPILWAEAESLLEPWANVTLTCRARLGTPDFQLFRDGVPQEHVHLDLITIQHQFPLGAVTGDNQGLYRCRSGLGSGWTQLSNLLEVTGAGEQGLLWGQQQWRGGCWRGPASCTPHSLSSSSTPTPSS